MNKRKFLISLILSFLVLIGGLSVYKIWSAPNKTAQALNKEKETLRQVSIKLLQAQTATNHINIDGRLSSYEKVNLSANISGLVLPTSKTLKKGMHFKKGDLLFDIDQRKAIFNLYALRSNLLTAITQIMPDLKIDHPDGYDNWKKYLDEFDMEHTVKPLPDIGGEPEKFLVVSRNVFGLYYNIKSAEAQLNDYKIYAPFSGVITRADVYPGALVIPGQPMAELINANHYELEAPVSERDLAYIKVGNSVELQSEATTNSWAGKVVRISNQIDPVTQSVPVYISVSGKNLKEGMYLKGQIKGIPLKEVASIPKDFIVKQQYIYIVKDSILKLQKLRIKNRDKDFVYAEGFESEVWMVNEDPRGLFEGQKVAVKQ